MTETQRNITRYQLKQWGNNCCTGFYEVKWQSCIANALNYYDEVNNVISQLIYLKFKKHKTKAEICDILYIGSTTYNNYKKSSTPLSQYMQHPEDASIKCLGVYNENR